MEPIFKYYDDYEKYIFFEPAKGFYENAVQMANNDKRILGVNEVFCYKEEIKNQRIDLILCSSLLHEVEDPAILLMEIKKVSCEDTVVHVNVPNAKSIHRIIAYEVGMIDNISSFSDRNVLLQQHTVFDMVTLCELVRSCGFEVIEGGSYFLKPFTHSQMYNMMKNEIIDKKVLDGLYGLEKYLPEYGSEIFVNIRLTN